MVKAATPSRRDGAIDIARGIAIIIMIGSNMGPVLQEPHSWLMRFYSSMAAPIFVMLAGMMIMRQSGKTGGHALGRAAMLLFWAVFTDMAAWHIRPFLGVDVLYMLAIGTVIAYGLRGLPTFALLMLTAVIALATPLLQHSFGYTIYPTEQELLSGQVTVAVSHQTPLWQHYLIDGWFPLFPWLGFMLAGMVLARHRWKGGSIQPFNTAAWLLAGAGLAIAGGLAWKFCPGIMYDRQGFSELFYPPTVGFFITATGIVLLLLAWADTGRSHRLAQVRLLGRHSLFIYVLHSLVIGQVFMPRWQDKPLTGYVFMEIYGLFVLAMVAAASFKQNLKMSSLRVWLAPQKRAGKP